MQLSIVMLLTSSLVELVL